MFVDYNSLERLRERLHNLLFKQVSETMFSFVFLLSYYLIGLDNFNQLFQLIGSHSVTDIFCLLIFSTS